MFFDTAENLPGTGDADGLRDVFEAAQGRMTLLSGSTSSGAGGKAARLALAPGDGSRVLFSTAENVPGTGDAEAWTTSSSPSPARAPAVRAAARARGRMVRGRDRGRTSPRRASSAR